MSKFALIFFVFVFSSASVSAAASLVFDEAGLIVGATDVEVEGSLYQVSFVGGTCADVFDPCVKPTDFAFNNGDSGLAAAEALNNVMANAGFANNPGKIFGCSPSGELCEIITPYGFEQVNVQTGGTAPWVTTAYSIITSYSPPGSDGFVRRDPVNEDLSNSLNSTYAVWSRALAYTNVVSVPDLNGDGSPETAGLIGHRVVIMDSVTGTEVKRLWYFWDAWKVKGIAAFTSGNGDSPKLAAVGQNIQDHRVVVDVKDIETGERILRISFFTGKRMTPISITVGDVDFDGTPDIGVMAVRQDGRGAVEYRNGSTGAKLPNWVANRILFPPS